MSIYLTKEQMDLYKKEIDSLIEEQEKKRDKNVSYKYKVSDLIDTYIYVKFEDKKPISAMIGREIIRPVSLSRNNTSDHCFRFTEEKQFNLFIESNPNFFLEIGSASERFSNKQPARACDFNGKRLIDFTN